MKNIALSVANFLSGVRLELTRIEWPSFDEFVGSTLVVLIIMCFFALYLGVLDRTIEVLVKGVLDYSVA